MAAPMRRSRYMVHPSFNQLFRGRLITRPSVIGKDAQMLPAAAGDEVPAPAVTELVRYHVDILAIS